MSVSGGEEMIIGTVRLTGLDEDLHGCCVVMIMSRVVAVVS